MKIKLLGDTAIIIYYENPDNSSSFTKVQTDYALLRNSALVGIKDIVPCYSSIGIYFDPELTKLDRVLAFVTEILSADNQPEINPGQIIHIPVYYGGEYGPDLPVVAETLHLSQEEVIAQHSRPEYIVWGIGFLPGFPYLGELPEALVLPRKTVPSARVAAGSVAIAGKQTGIYPYESPGGWYVIGQTPLQIFDLNSPEPALLKPGDRVKFIISNNSEVL